MLFWLCGSWLMKKPLDYVCACECVCVKGAHHQCIIYPRIPVTLSSQQKSCWRNIGGILEEHISECACFHVSHRESFTVSRVCPIYRTPNVWARYLRFTKDSVWTCEGPPPETTWVPHAVRSQHGLLFAFCAPHLFPPYCLEQMVVFLRLFWDFVSGFSQINFTPCICQCDHEQWKHQFVSFVFLWLLPFQHQVAWSLRWRGICE